MAIASALNLDPSTPQSFASRDLESGIADTEPEKCSPPSTNSSSTTTLAVMNPTAPLPPQETIEGAPSVPNEGQQHKKKEPYPWRLIVPNFSPAWFASVMGTGITAILIHSLPTFHGQLVLSSTPFALNALLFLLLTTLSLARLLLYPRNCLSTLLHPTNSLFLGTIPMGLATLINLTVQICTPAYGSRAVNIAWGSWWLDVALSLGTAIGVPFLLTTHSTARPAPETLQTLTAALLLPIVAPIVAAASGGLVAEALAEHGNPAGALVTVVASYVLWGTGVPLAVCVLAIYLQRLITWRAVPRSVAVSVFLPLGPLGQGAFGITLLGRVARTIFPAQNFLSPLAGEVFYAAGVMAGLVIWGFGLVWLVWATGSVLRWARTGGFGFNLGWWAFTFPLGVFTTATLLFGEEFGSVGFRVLGTILSITVAALWAVVFSGTVWKTWTGDIFRV